MTEAVLDDPLFAELRAAYGAGDLTVFVGAGLSAGAGLPTWEGLVRSLFARLEKRTELAELIDGTRRRIDSKQMIDAISLLKEGLGAEFNGAVEQALDDEGREPPASVEALVMLKPKLRAVLTTNLDRLVERAFGWPALARMAADSPARRRHVLKLHGTLAEPDTWVLTRRQYEQAINALPHLQQAFRTLYTGSRMLFVGCGMADDNLEHTFGRIRALANDQPPRHFVLMRKGTLDSFRRKELGRAGLRFLLYEEHAELPNILRQIDDAALSVVSAPQTGYVPRLREERAAREHLGRKEPISFLGPHHFGKSSLLHWLAELARGAGARVIHLDLKALHERAGGTWTEWMEAFAIYLDGMLGGDGRRIAALRQMNGTWSTRLSVLLEGELKQAGGQLMLAIENADVAWGKPFQESFFQLLRAWCEEARSGRSPWDRLQLVFAVSTTPALYKTGPSDSPWNLAPPVLLGDWDAAEVKALVTLNDREPSDDEVKLLLDRVGGHPYLLRALAQQRKLTGGTLAAVIEESERLEGPLASHLRDVGTLLNQDDELVRAVNALLDNPKSAVAPRLLDRLEGASLVVPIAKRTYKIRFPLYDTYLRSWWTGRADPASSQGSRST